MTSIDDSHKVQSSRAALVGALCALVLALAAPTAFATGSAETVAGLGSGPGQVEDPQGVAVDNSLDAHNGLLYVADEANNRIEELDPSKPPSERFRLAFGFGVRDGAAELQTCGPEASPPAAVCEGGISGSGPGQMRPWAVAVDESLGGEGDIYVADAENRRVEKFSPTGEFLLMFGGEVDKTTHADVCTREDIEVKHDTCGAGVFGFGPGAFALDKVLSVDSFGHVWVGDSDRLEQFGPDGKYISEVKLPSPSTVESLAVDSSGDFQTINDLDEVQMLTPPASGTFTLRHFNEVSSTLTSNASAGEVQSALDKVLPNPEVKVEGPAGGPYRIEYAGDLGGEIKEVAVSAGSLTTTQEGGFARKVEKLGPSGELLQTLDESGHPKSLALNGTGGLFVSGQPKGASVQVTLLEFDSGGAQTEAFGFGEVIGNPQFNGLAFASATQRLFTAGGGGNVVQSFTVPPAGPLIGFGSTNAGKVGKAAATFCAKANPEGKSTGVRFEYITEAQYREDHEEFGAGTLQTPESSSIGEDFEFHEICQQVTSLNLAVAYRFRAGAVNSSAPAGNVGEAASFETEPPVAIDSSSVSGVTSSSAVLEAVLNPLGEAASYRFEYISEASYLKNEEEKLSLFTGASQIPLHDAPLGAGSTDVSVSQNLQGLAPRTAYRFRVVGLDSLAPGGFPASTLTFTTQATGPFALPDDRAWELVSPPNKHGASLESDFEGEYTLQAAAGGEAVSYPATGPTESEPQGFTNFMQVLSTRGSGGWSSRDLEGPHSEETGDGFSIGLEYRNFSADLSRAAYQPFGGFEPSLSPGASEQTAYLRTDFPTGNPDEACTESCFRPMVAACPGEGESCSPSVEADADVLAGTVFGGDPECIPILCGPRFAGGTPDLSHVALSSSVPLTAMGGTLYEWSPSARPAQALQSVGVLPASEGGKAVAALLGARENTGIGGNLPRTAGAISADGSRLVWTAEESSHLYLRDMTRGDEGETIRLDEVQPGASGKGLVKPRFQVADAEQSRVFFTDEQRLTEDAGASEDEPDLYECQIAEVAGRLHCNLSDLTPAIFGEHADVQGAVLGASEDGSQVYFVAEGDLAPGAQPGRPNLYIHHSGATKLIAVLSPGDSPDWAKHQFPPTIANLSARVSPSGRWLAFMSDRSLTGYDNSDALDGSSDEEVYLYNSETGRVVCASCNPTGARPLGAEFGSGTHEPEEELLGGNRTWSVAGGSVAGMVPGWTEPYYQARYLSDSGRLFFESKDALVSQDTNHTWDVYEYEPPAGEGSPPADSCTVASSTYSPHSAGCVSLISSGVSPEPSGFVDASESGDDVFFYTDAKLVSEDEDDSRDLYDAHVCSAESPCPPPPPPPQPACNGDACQSPVASPEDPTPGSLSFKGPGNIAPVSPPAVKPKSLTRAQKLAAALKVCKRKPKKRRAVCEKRARQTYGPVGKAKRSKRRAG